MIKGTCGNNLSWTLDDGGKLTISGTGSMEDYYSFLLVPWETYSGQIKTIEIKQGVISIGDRAFFYCTSLKSITIPNGVKYIGDEAFSWCKSLTSITILNSVTSIGDYAFNGCSSLTSITIPNSVTSIGEGAFSVCTSLTSITLPNSVTSIGDYAFFECESLTSITLPNSVTSIGDSAFFSCKSLTSITISNSIKSIGKWAFRGTGAFLQSLGRYKAVKIINNKYFCRDCEFELNKWSDKLEDIKLCESGYHYCTNLFEIFNYYYGELDKDIAIFEVETKGEDFSDEDSSKHCCQQIKLTKRLYKDDIIKLLNK